MFWITLSIIELFVIVGKCFANSMAYLHCADLQPQPHVSIEQLMGMWYGIEIISHKRDVAGDIDNYTADCPVVYFFEENTATTLSPLYPNYNYGFNYGSGYDLNNQQQQRQQDPYQQRPRYPTASSHHRKGQKLKFKHMRMWWVEYENGVEYNLKYNETRPGFWISSGPQNGSSLEPQYDNFAGTVQVLKAVGSHLVLTFCYQMPDKQLYSVILGRENKLNVADIHGVHSLLTRKGLDIIRSRRVCAYSGGISNNEGAMKTMILLSLVLCVYRKVSSDDS